MKARSLHAELGLTPYPHVNPDDLDALLIHCALKGVRMYQLRGPLRIRRCFDRPAHVLALRYGVDGGGFRTLAQVAAIIGITREQIRQYEARGLNHLRSRIEVGKFHLIARDNTVHIVDPTLRRSYYWKPLPLTSIGNDF